MTGQDQPVIPAAGSHKPGAVNVRLVCPPDVMAAAMASLSDFYGDAWQPSARKPSRDSEGRVLQYGTLIVPVHAAARLGPQCPSVYPGGPGARTTSEQERTLSRFGCSPPGAAGNLGIHEQRRAQG